MKYRSMLLGPTRRDVFRGVCTVAAGGAVLGVLGTPANGEESKTTPVKPTTNIDEFTATPRGRWSIPGPHPGRVVQVADPRALNEDVVDAAVVREMLEAGLAALTGKTARESFGSFFEPTDVVGLKVNPVGAPVINTRLELTEAVIRWLWDSGLPASNIVIWDRFQGMLTEAGYTTANFPDVRIEALQRMVEEGDGWRAEDGRHVSEDNFDLESFYLATGVEGRGVPGYKDDEFYLNQHVFAGERSYFGKLITEGLTKIVNLPAVKNTGHGISVATKNLGYAVICNTGRLHRPLFFDVCTEVLAAPCVRDKLVLNIADALRAQYGGGPGLDAQYVYRPTTLYLATDPFALDMICHRHVLARRKEAEMIVDEHPRYTEYLHYGERLGLGIADPERIELVEVTS